MTDSPASARRPRMKSAVSETMGDDASVSALCRECGYDLRGLPTEGVCPECGTRIRVSLQGPGLLYAAPDWLRAVSKGVTSLQVGIVGLLFAIPSARLSVAGTLVGCAAAALRCYGVWQMSRTDLRLAQTARSRAGQWIFRTVAAVDLVASTALPLIRSWWLRPVVYYAALLIVAQLSIVNAAFCLWTICRRLIGSTLRRSTAVVAWLLLGLFVLPLAMLALRSLVHLTGHADQVASVIGWLAGPLFVGCALVLLSDLGGLQKILKRGLKAIARPVRTDVAPDQSSL
jgi:hypothetical protein